MKNNEVLTALYKAFNARDVDAVLAMLTPDVDWPNGWEGGRLTGHEAVRDYWDRQWVEIDPHVDPTSITSRPDGEVEVRVHQVVHDRHGTLLGDDEILHIYTFQGSLIRRMVIAKRD